MKTIFKTLCIALLFASCSKEEIVEPIQPNEVISYKYEIGFLQTFQGQYSTLTVTSTEVSTIIENIEAGLGFKIKGSLTNNNGIHNFRLFDIPNGSTFYFKIYQFSEDQNGDTITTTLQDNTYICGTNTVWLLDYNANTNILISTP
jgi:hypothetical protein